MKPLFLSRIFLSGAFISSIVYSNEVLDRTLVPRFIAFSIVLLITYLFLRPIENQQQGFDLNGISIAYIAYFIICIISISYAINKAEALFESLRVFTGLSLFLLFFRFTLQEPEFEAWFLRGISILTFLAVGYCAIQLYSLDSIDVKSLYNITSISGHKNLFASLLFLFLVFNLAGSLSPAKVWRAVAIAGAVLCIVFILLLQDTKENTSPGN
jgi:hypothetical protein